MPPLTSFSMTCEAEQEVAPPSLPQLSCEEDEISLRLEKEDRSPPWEMEQQDRSPPWEDIPPPPCRPFSATSVSHKR